MSVWRATFQWFKTDDSTFGQNVLYFNNQDNAMSLSAMGVELDQQWWTALKPLTTNVVRLDAIFFKDVGANPPGGTLPYATTLSTGTVGVNVMHQTLGFVFQIFDGTSGPKGRGRMYHYGSPSNHMNRSGPQPSAVTAFNTFRATWMTRYVTNGGTSGLRWVLWHRQSAQGDPAFASNITDIRLNPRICVQRRRNFGVGL